MSLLLLFGGSGAGTVSLVPAELTLTAQPLTATPGPGIVTLVPATLTFTAVAVTPTGAAGIVSLVPATLTFTPQPFSFTVSGTNIALAPGLFSFVGIGPVVLLGTDPVWRTVIVRPPAMTEVEEIIPDPNPSVPRTFDESHVEQANELGQFALSTFDTDSLDIELGDLVAFYDRAICIGGGVIRQRRTYKKSKQHEGKQLVNWTGVRPLGVLEEAPIFPARGLGSTAQDRIWGWFGITYDDATWGTATYVGPATGGTFPYWSSEVEDFDDPTAERIWAARRAGNPPLDEFSPEGECLFRATFTVPTGVTEVEVQLAGDDWIEAYYEGEALLDTRADSGEPPHVRVRRARVSVLPGENLLAVAVANSTDIVDEFGADQNPAFFMGAIFAVGSDGALGDLLWHTSTTTSILEYPAYRPGVTPGHVLLEVLAEVQNAGYVNWVVPTFTAEVDSGGVPWVQVGEIGTKVGYSLWKLTQQLVAVYVETDLSPATNEWHVWNQGRRGRHTGIDLDDVLQEHTVTETLMRGNVILDYSKFGWQQHSDVPPGAARRIAATLGLGALPSSSEVDRWATAELDESKENRREDEVVVLHEDDSTKPYWSYSIGDSVTVDGQLLPVQEVSWRRDRQGVIWWDQDA